MTTERLSEAEMAALVDSQLSGMESEWKGRGVGCQHWHGDKMCGELATFVIEAHALDMCDGPNTNANGDRVELFCGPCADGTRVLAKIVIARRLYRTVLTGYPSTCSTCGAEMTKVEHLIRSCVHHPAGVR